MSLSGTNGSIDTTEVALRNDRRNIGVDKETILEKTHSQGHVHGRVRPHVHTQVHRYVPKYNYKSVGTDESQNELGYVNCNGRTSQDTEEY